MRNGKELLNIFENYLQENKFNMSPGELYEPVNYILDLGGKRMRPTLVLMGCELFGGEVQTALPAAYAVELFHNFTLMHDDIMDHAPLRRGKATVHEKFGQSSAILSGDVTMIYAYEYLTKLPDHHFLNVVKAFNEAAIKVCDGQQYDINFQEQQDVTISDYLLMIEYKTAALLAGSLKIGALIGGAGAEDSNKLYEFGRNMGISFQLMDDLLDTFGDPQKTGKQPGGDIAENKKTYLLLKTLELSDDNRRKELEFYLSNNVPHKEKIKGIKSIMEQYNVEALTRKEIEWYHQISIENLENINILEDKKAALKAYAEKFSLRQF